MSSIDDYNLFYTTNKSTGLSNVKNSEMTQIKSGRAAASGFNVFLSGTNLINAIKKLPYQESKSSTNLESSLSIGFDFVFNDTTYKNIHVSPFGWLTLDDPNMTNWDLKKFISEESSATAGCLISGYVTTVDTTQKTIILAPWWDVQKNHNEILYISGTTVSGTYDEIKSQFLDSVGVQQQAYKHVFHGKSISQYVNQTNSILTTSIQNNVLNDYEPDKFGVRYARKYHKKFGNSLIIRWNSITYYKKVSFEVVLYENGRIEYRYQPNSKNVDIDTTYTPLWRLPSNNNINFSKAAIGVFGVYGSGDSGPGGFIKGLGRDFTPLFKSPIDYQGRVQTKYYRGGAVLSDENYKDYYLTDVSLTYLPFCATLDVRYDWPAQNEFGAMFVFEPKKNCRKKLPRNDITINKVFVSNELFDDRRSLLNTTNVVHFPTKLNRYAFGDTIYSEKSADLFETGLFATGTITNNFVDVSDDFTKDVDISFNDSKSISPISTQDVKFFLTGSSEPNFEQNLLSKDVIEIELPLNFATQLLPTSSGMWYYDRSTKSLSLCHNDNYEYSFGNQDRATSDITRFAVAEDYIGFDPYGHLICSGTKSGVLSQGGTYDTVGTQSDELINIRLTQDNFNAAIQKSYNNSVCVSQKYNANSNQTFTLPIQHPFIIEKAEIEFPLEANNGWCLDKTTVYHRIGSAIDESGIGIYDNIGDKIVSGTQFPDIGGPAITCALFHQFDSINEKKRNLILSATITTEIDKIPSVEVLYGDVAACFSPSGFDLIGGKAATYVVPNNIFDVEESIFTHFTGSVKVFSEPMIGCGCTAIVRNIAWTSSSVTNQQLLLNFIQQQTIDLHSVATSPITSGTTININKIHPLGRNQQGFQSEGQSLFGKNFSSNNVLNVPNIKTIFNDNLSIWYQWYQFRDKFITVYPIGLTTFKKSPYIVFPNQQLIFSLSKSRPIKKLFGQPTNVEDFPYSHDVKIPTGSIKLKLYGSYVKENAEYHQVKDKIYSEQVCDVIGNDPVLDQFEIFSRGMTYDHYYDRFMTGTMTLGTRKKAFNISNADTTNGILEISNFYSDFFIKQYELSTILSSLRINDENEIYYDSLAPDMKAIAKLNNGYSQDLLAVKKETEFYWYLNSSSYDRCWSWGYPFEGRYSQINRNFKSPYQHIFVYCGAFKRNRYGVWNESNQLQTAFGFGDSNNYTGPVGTLHPIFGTITNGLNVGGGNNLPHFRNVSDSNSQSPMIRGWKYGLYSGIRSNSNCVFRRSSYGQLRDMLEQRLYGNIIISDSQNSIINVRFVNSASFVNIDPIYTQSSNKSMYCTSSLPYFDGISRN